MRNIKQLLRKLLLFLLEKLNMPKTYAEFSYKNMDDIRLVFESAYVDVLANLIGNTRSLRVFKGPEYFVLEYKKQNAVSIDYNYNNPDLSINIKNNFSCTVTGFDSIDENFIMGIVQRYLKANDFIR